MIRINLLGVPRAKRGKRSSAGMAGGGGAPNILVVLLVLVALTAGTNWYYYNSLQKDAVKLQAQIDDAKRENLRLADIKAKYVELEKEKDLYERRVNVIHQLQENQKGPGTLLSTISDTVNKSEAVWLKSMREDGNNITLEGTALSVDAVAGLMKNLKSSGYFKNIEIKSTFQDAATKDMAAFSFMLVCERNAPNKKS
ncbi:MAG: PilN domain-containing protein [Terriglobales bacterium]